MMIYSPQSVELIEKQLENKRIEKKLKSQGLESLTEEELKIYNENKDNEMIVDY